jgi:hypothetical protein
MRMDGPQSRFGPCGEEEISHYCPCRELNLGRPASIVVIYQVTRIMSIYCLKTFPKMEVVSITIGAWIAQWYSAGLRAG